MIGGRCSSSLHMLVSSTFPQMLVRASLSRVSDCRSTKVPSAPLTGRQLPERSSCLIFEEVMTAPGRQSMYDNAWHFWSLKGGGEGRRVEGISTVFGRESVGSIACMCAWIEWVVFRQGDKSCVYGAV